MILQTYPRLGPKVNEYGCYFMSILFQAGQRLSRTYTVDEIIKIKEGCIRKGYMDSDCYIQNPNGIFAVAGLRVKYTDTHESPDRVAAPNEIEILAFKQPGYTHFVAGSGGQVAYDPLGQSQTVSQGELISKRLFEVLS